ncbi:type VI secretion protein [Azorhizobium oxalatiphilum]|uniref:Type VI secretion protein n=1 Tax=Azorhizobium oxalatiphilum TaxID=980631 RepID=A0A917F7E6_9HYPH|nr:type VI secretion system protein TssA [Azorhizobium oxalatiphilum]GGF57745.1 type VI secretion protein [Azorhizobium oxalatiphilum]
MTVEPTFDTAETLAPIGDEPGYGEDPRADMAVSSLFLQMKDARAGARRKERALDVDPDAPPADEEWGQVGEFGFQILAGVGKDLEVAAWMIEALVRLDGFKGLYTGLTMAEGLVRTYWDGVYPLPDEDGNEGRLAPFIALNGGESDGLLIQPLRKVPLTSGSDHLSLWQYEQAKEIAAISDETRREARLSSGGISMDAFDEAVRSTPPSFFAGLVEQIEACLAAANALSDAFSAHVGMDAPPAGAIRNVLNTVLEEVHSFAASKLEQASASQALAEAADITGTEGGESGEVAADGTPAPAGAVTRAGISSREQALRTLLDVAAFFRTNEPHSPISYTLEEIVRRARMPLGALLEELIVDADARRYFYIAAGLRPPAPPEEAQE